MKTTPEMIARIRELATPPRDDFDRAVLLLADDADAFQAALRRLVTETFDHGEYTSESRKPVWAALCNAQSVLAAEPIN